MEGIFKNAKLNMDSNRDMSLDAVKGFAILMVMIGHCIVLNELADAYLYDAINAIQMPLFMAVSGYLIGMKPFAGLDKPDIGKWMRTLGRRSAAYLIPFFSWMIIVSFPHCLTELKTELFHLDYGLWFLMTLWIISLVSMIATFIADTLASFMSTKMKESHAVVMRVLIYGAIVLLAYVGFFVQGRTSNSFLSPSLTLRYMPYYIIAYLIAYLRSYCCKKKETSANVSGKIKSDYILIPLCIVSAIVFVILDVQYDMVVAPDFFSLAIQMLASLLGSFVCFFAVARFCKGKIQSGLAFIGQYTLEIYVLHFRFARLLKLADKGLVPFHLDTILWVIATFIVMSVLTTICIFVIKKLWIFDLILFGKVRSRN